MRPLRDLPMLRNRQLPPWLGRNLRVKMLAMLLALASWVVVVYAANPPDSRQILVHVQQDSQQLPGHYVLARPIDDITVRISGTREHVDAFQASSIHATPNFDAIRRTGTQQLPLTVINTDPNVDISEVPGSVTADVDLTGTTTVPVLVRPTSRTQVGYVIVSATAEPARVSLVGPQRELGVAQAVVDVNLGTRTNTLVQDGLPVIVIDPHAGNRPLTDVSVREGTVRVKVVITPVDGQAVSTVLPAFSGAVAPGHMVSAVTVDPQTVLLSGPENLLNGAHLTTAPIALNGLTSDRIFSVTLQVPDGLKTDVTTVNVHVFITALPEAVITPTPATPAASASPRSTSPGTPAPACTQAPLGTPCPGPRPT